jgi:predicted transcriptional regulator
MSTIDACLEHIRAYAISSHLTRTEVSRLAGLSEGTTRRMFKGDWNPRAKTLRAIESAFAERDKQAQRWGFER